MQEVRSEHGYLSTKLCGVTRRKSIILITRSDFTGLPLVVRVTSLRPYSQISRAKPLLFSSK
jgi:hypothetical protein